MRVALVTPGGVDPTAEERSFPYLLALIGRLARNHDVQVFSLHQGTQPSTYPLAGTTVHDAGVPPGAGRRRAYLRTARSIIAQHRRAPFDVLHAFWLVPSGLIAAAVGRWIGRPLVVHLAGGELVSLPDIGYGWQVSWRTRLWTRLAMAGATRLSAASAPMIASAAALGYAAERIPFGVDLTRWPPAPPRARPPGDPARLLHVGNLNQVKDQRVLMRAVAILAARGVAFRLDVAGLDTMGGAVAAEAARLGVADRVQFHGLLPQRRLRPLVEQAHVHLLSSRHEAGPFAMLEAAVAGVPTVGTAVGHVAEWAPSAAIAVSLVDAEYRLARETEHLLSNDASRLDLAVAAQRRAVAEDADWTARRVEALYGEMVTGANATNHAR